MSIQNINRIYAVDVLENNRRFWETYHRKANDSIRLIKSGYFTTLLENAIRTDNMIDYIIQLSRKYSDICLTNDLEVKNCLINLGFTDKELIWLLNGQGLFDKMNAIIKSGKYMLSIPIVFGTLDGFLTSKIYKTVIDKYRIKDREQKIPITFKRLITVITNTERNKSNRILKGKPDIISDFDLVWDSLKKDELKQAGITDALAFFTQMQSRNLDRLLIPIYTETINLIPDSPEKGIPLSENEKLRTMYDLFCQMLPHREWSRNLSDFINSTKGDGMDFEEYKTRTMRKFIFKR